jgi:hypothetical protein
VKAKLDLLVEAVEAYFDADKLFKKDPSSIAKESVFQEAFNDLEGAIEEYVTAKRAKRNR